MSAMKDPTSAADRSTAARLHPGLLRDGDVAQTVQAAASDRRLDKAHVKIQMGGIAAAVEAYRSAPTPNVIIIENAHGRNELVAGLDSLRSSATPARRS